MLTEKEINRLLRNALDEERERLAKARSQIAMNEFLIATQKLEIFALKYKIHRIRGLCDTPSDN